MTALAANSLQLDPAPEFLILSALQPDSAAWAQAAAQLDDVRVLCARVLGFEPKLRLAPGGKLRIQPRGETFVIPAAFDFSLWERESMGQQIAGQRRDYPDS